jgi:hypothetical protein
MNSRRRISDLLRLDRQPIAVGAVCLALSQSFLRCERRLLAHSRDGGRPSWPPVIGVVLPPLWHQGHSAQDLPPGAIIKREPRSDPQNLPRTAVEAPRNRLHFSIGGRTDGLRTSLVGRANDELRTVCSVEAAGGSNGGGTPHRHRRIGFAPARFWRHGLVSAHTVPNQVLGTTGTFSVRGAGTHGRPPQEQRGQFLKSAGDETRHQRRYRPRADRRR